MKNKIVTVRKAKVSDAQNIRRLEESVWGEEVVNKYDIPMFIRFGWCFVAEADNKLVGAILSYHTKEGEVYVCDWVVVKSYRKQDIGIKLYNRLLVEVAGKNIVTFLDPNKIPTVEAHKKLGFELVDRIKNPYDLKSGIEGGYRLFVRKLNK